MIQSSGRLPQSVTLLQGRNGTGQLLSDSAVQAADRLCISGLAVPMQSQPLMKTMQIGQVNIEGLFLQTFSIGPLP